MKKKRRKLKREVKYTLIGIAVLIVLILSANIFGKGNIKIDFSKLKIKNIFYTLDNYSPVDLYLTMEIKDDGYDVYVPKGSGYRYGPSIIYYDDGTMDAWFATNGNNSSIWDWVTYRHFDGEEWSEEEIVLKPTKESLDHYSVCDPGVFYYDGYYYIGYTSTTNSTNGGVENNIFVARSKKPNGEYEKWDGKGWGGKPEPIIEYKNGDLQWGIGEPSFVIKDNTLYCYYTLINGEGSFTKVKTAELCENWPEKLIDNGVAFKRQNDQGSFDVVYDDISQEFIAFGIENNFGKKSRVALYESYDGLRFEQTDSIKGIEKYAHNMGISKKPNGHINFEDNLVLGYAYSKGSYNVWGKWATKFQTVKLKFVAKRKLFH